MAKGNSVKWVFNGTKLDRATVKRHVLEALREPGFRRAVDRLLLDNKEAEKKLKDILEREIQNSTQLIEALESDQVFDIIFEIAE